MLLLCIRPPFIVSPKKTGNKQAVMNLRFIKAPTNRFFRMPQFVVFLRGINVSGHTVVKERLQKAFTLLGFEKVSTYKQSGNVIFDAALADTKVIKKKVEAKLRDVLGYDVAAFIYTIPQLKQIIALEPFKGQEKEGASFLVTFGRERTRQVPAAVAADDSEDDRANNIVKSHRHFQRNPRGRRRRKAQPLH